VRAPLARLALAVLCGYAAIGAGIQVLPGAARERFAAGEWAIGAAVTAASLAAVLARPPAGRRADERGPRAVVVCGGLLAGAGALGQLLAPSLAWLVAARLLIGAGEGALFTAAITWVLSAAPPERRGRIVGHFGLSMWGGLALGPPLGAALAAATSTEVVWWACVIAPALPALTVLTAPAPRRGAAARRGAGGRLVPREAVRPGVALALVSFGYGTLNAFLVLRFEAAGFAGAGAALGVFGGAFLLVRLVGSPLVDRVSAPVLMGGCAATEALGLAALALAPAEWVAFAGIVLAGLGTALVYPILATLVATRAEPERRGAAVGALTSSWDLGLALAGPVGGALGVHGAFGVAAVLALVGGVPRFTVLTGPKIAAHPAQSRAA
jgi:MFS family permease